MSEVALSVPASVLAGARARQNWTILLGAVLLDALLLWIASHAPLPAALPAVVLFAFSNNTLFSLMHEAVHGNFDPSPVRNDRAGAIAAVFFPTAFTLQRSAHLTHHRNNRSELERFDYIAPGEAIPLKTAQWFSILTGLYWAGIPLFLLFYVLFAEAVPWQRLVRRSEGFSNQTSAGEFLDSLMRLPVWRVRAEFVLSLAVQATLVMGLDLTLGGWALCYGAFALAWSSLQYADHAFSRLDRIEGAWNLKVGRFTRRMFLNYHFHLQHHRDLNCPWQQLPAQADAQADPPRSFLSVLLLMWRGPRLLPGSGQDGARQRLLDRCIMIAHVAVFGAVFELVYGLASLDFGTHRHLWNVALPIDAAAPFVPVSGLLYISITPLLLAAALILRTPTRTLPFLGALIFQVIVAGLCFVLFPVAPPVPPPVDPHTLSGVLFAMADAINLQGNCMPSLHVALALSGGCAAAPHLRPAWRFAMWVWVLAVCASTWLTWQHWLLDIAGGALLALVGMKLVMPWLADRLRAVDAELIGPAAASG